MMEQPSRGKQSVGIDISKPDGRETPFIRLILLQSDKHWEDLVRRLGVPEMATDPRFADSTARAQNSAEGPAQFDEQAVQVPGAPEHGEHTEMALMAAGLDWDQITAMKESGAIL